jgi:hypothetical protein
MERPKAMDPGDVAAAGRGDRVVVGTGCDQRGGGCGSIEGRVTGLELSHRPRSFGCTPRHLEDVPRGRVRDVEQGSQFVSPRQAAPTKEVTEQPDLLGPSRRDRSFVVSHLGEDLGS